MKRLLISGAVLLAWLAWAGSRANESTGAVPSLATDGVSLNDSEGCRLSVREADGGTLNGGTLAVWYYDARLGWVRSASALDCVLESNKLADGGAPSAQVCPDLQPLARFGRLGVEARGLVGLDGGSPNGLGVDGGANVAPVLRVECWGRAIP